jgi:histone-lysine N-methyltransferase SETMAR
MVRMWGGDTCFSSLSYLVALVSSAMSEREVPPAIAQHIIVKFLTNEGVKSSDILTRMRAQFGDMTLSSTQVYDWASKFKGGRETAENENHNRRPRSSLTDDNIRAICDLIEGLTVDEIASEVNISHGSAHSIITEHLGFSKVCARWVPRLLTHNQKQV